MLPESFNPRRSNAQAMKVPSAPIRMVFPAPNRGGGAPVLVRAVKVEEEEEPLPEAMSGSAADPLG